MQAWRNKPFPQKTKNADVAELADALVSGSSEAIHVGSSPVIRTKWPIFSVTLFLFWKWRSKNVKRSCNVSEASGNERSVILDSAVFPATHRQAMLTRSSEGFMWVLRRLENIVANLRLDTLALLISLFSSGTSRKTVINCFSLAYPSPAPAKEAQPPGCASFVHIYKNCKN